MEKQVAQRRKEDGSDGISELPQPILHHILYFLSRKEAIQTSVLSKTWRYLWSGLPKIDFRETDFVGICEKCHKSRCLRGFTMKKKKKKTFLSALDMFCQSYHDQKLSINKFRLEMIEADSELVSLLGKWIPKLIIPNMSLQKFSLHFTRLSLAYFDLPSVVFQVKSLKKLYLEKCKVSRIDKVLLKCLQTLSLTRVCIEEETFEMLMSSCPLIENVVLRRCKGLRALKVISKHHNLKHLSFSAYHENRLEDTIDAPSIEIDAPNLISLSLTEVRLSMNLFKKLSSNFPCLEELSLYFCDGLEELQISSPSIKHLSLSVLRSPIKATIDAPNLHDFRVTGEFPQSSISFTTTSSAWKSHIDMWFHEEMYDDELPWLLNLDELLRALSKSQVSLDACFDCLRNEPIGGGFNHEPVVVENLSLCLLSSYANSSPFLPEFLNGLFHVCRPRYTEARRSLHFHESTDCSEIVSDELNDFLCKVLMQERDKMDYFWQKDLEEVCMEVWDKKTNEWNPTSLPDSKFPDKQYIRFRLKWRD